MGSNRVEEQDQNERKREECCKRENSDTHNSPLEHGPDFVFDRHGRNPLQTHLCHKMAEPLTKAVRVFDGKYRNAAGRAHDSTFPVAQFNSPLVGQIAIGLCDGVEVNAERGCKTSYGGQRSTGASAPLSMWSRI